VTTTETEVVREMSLLYFTRATLSSLHISPVAVVGQLPVVE